MTSDPELTAWWDEIKCAPRTPSCSQYRPRCIVVEAARCSAENRLIVGRWTSGLPMPGLGFPG